MPRHWIVLKTKNNMKARVKESGEVFVVYGVVNKTCDGYAIGEVELFVDDHDSFQYDMTPAYWERLKHQAAISAMQGILACEEWKISPREGVSFAGEVALQAHELATALVEKLKNE